MDAHSELVQLRGYVEGLAVLPNTDERLEITGFQFMMLMEPLARRLKALELQLAAKEAV